MIDPNSFEVGEGAILDLVVIFSRNVASLTGDVELPQDQPDKDAHVLLIPKAAGASFEFSRRHLPKLDQTLAFSEENLPPGKYLAFAVPEIAVELWSNQEFLDSMRPQAVEVELAEKDHSAVHLKMITRDGIETVRRRLGL